MKILFFSHQPLFLFALRACLFFFGVLSLPSESCSAHQVLSTNRDPPPLVTLNASWLSRNFLPLARHERLLTPGRQPLEEPSASSSLFHHLGSLSAQTFEKNLPKAPTTPELFALLTLPVLYPALRASTFFVPLLLSYV